MKLRDYQETLVADVRAAWTDGKRNALAVLATGGGKSVCLSSVIADERASSCVIAHRQELVTQLSTHLAHWGIQHRVIAPKPVVRRCGVIHREELGRSFVNHGAIASVASVDTLVSKSRAHALKPWAQQVGLWVIDEAAHVLQKNKWGAAVKMFPNARGLGVTATPCRADGNGLGSHASGVFDAMVIGPDTRNLILRGALTDYAIVLPKSDLDLSGVNITASGDFSQKGLRAAAEKSRIVGDVVENYQRFAADTQAVVFATDVATAERMAESFNLAGIPAAAVSGETPDSERARSVADFRAGKIRVLINVDLFDEGFDLPAIETVIMARPTWSLAKYLQMIGRGLRLMTGKTRALVIDHVSNVKRHGLPDASRQWTLDDREKRSRKTPDPNLIPVTHCGECMHAYERIHKACPYCGFEPQPLARPGPEQVDGDLTMLDGDTLDKLRAATELDSPDAVASRARYAAGDIAGHSAAKRQRERIEAQAALRDGVALWAGVKRSEGMTDSQMYRLFYFKFGVSVSEVLAMSKKEMNATLEKVLTDM